MSDSDCGDFCSCRPLLPRRDFIRLAGALTLGAAVGGTKAFAGPFQSAKFSEVPLDKKLSPEWVKSLQERGEPKRYTGSALQHIGMPVGGICAGMVYLGGDGKLWHWDIFNQNKTGIIQKTVHYAGRDLGATDGAAYVQPIPSISELHQGFWLRVDGARRPLEAGGWKDISFTGQYPVGVVSYSDPSTKVSVQLTAFSPFIPLNEDDSGLPTTLMRYRIANGETHPVEVEIGGFLENAIGRYTTLDAEIVRATEPLAQANLTAQIFRARSSQKDSNTRQDILVEDWHEPEYQGWTVEGSAFGKGPVLRKDVPDYQGDLGGPGDRVVNSHATAPGSDIATKDGATGKLTGPDFTADRKFLNFWIGGGSTPGKTCLNLVCDGKVVQSATGSDANRMHVTSLPLDALLGKTVHLEIVDSATGAWGNIGIGRIWQSDQRAKSVPLEKHSDFGSMAIGLFEAGQIGSEGEISVKKTIPAGGSVDVTFAICWHFPNLLLGIADDSSGRYYAKRFKDAESVLRYLSANLKRLTEETLLWRDTWYDSTLPYWFLDRTFANTSTLATTTAHRFGTGRFYAWEGIGCCAGTCTHVWHYAQAMGRLFPALERDLRERVDYGVGFHEDTGAIGFRAEFDGTAAVDGQAGSILRTYREHQTSTDSAFLQRVWPRAKRATEWLIGLDRDQEGILQGAQENTLDAAWFGKIAWTSSLYNAALRASAAMATEVGDTAFTDRCLTLAMKGKRAIEAQLFNGEYFIQTRDPEHAGALGTYKTCHIDQVMGQGWAWQVGMGRVLDRDKTVSALKALYKYNFTPDVGPFRKKHVEGRWYAMPGDGGMIMVTNPKAEPNAFGDSQAWQYGYFNECMSGFEHQVAAHMIAEDMVFEGLAVTRAIHDRYDASLRNPYNEIECSDHYARAMASYGSFISACGFEYHGPSGTIGFSPRIGAENFKAAFTAAEGWGTYSQQRGAEFTANIVVRWGKVRLKTIKFSPGVKQVGAIEVRVGNQVAPSTWSGDGELLAIRLNDSVEVNEGQELKVWVTSAP